MEKVLVIDDSLSVRVALERILKRRPIEVLTAATGMTGVAAMLERSPALVICDLVLPDRDGISLARFVRQHPLLKGIPFVLISGAADEATARKAREAGCEAVLTKPFTPEAVLGILDRLLGERQLLAAPTPPPIASGAPAPEPFRTTEPRPSVEVAKKRILVVDDSLSVRVALERILSREGYQTASASAANEAIRRLTSEAFDLLICDVVLPESDGTEITRFVRGHPALAALPVILVSGLAGEKTEEAARQAGANGVVRKPFTAETLLPIVNRLCKGAPPSAPVPAASRPPAAEEPARARPAPVNEIDLARLAFLQARTVSGVRWAMLINRAPGSPVHSIGLEAGEAEEPSRRLAALLPALTDLGAACGRGPLQSGILDYGEGLVVFMTLPFERVLAVFLSDARQLGLLRLLFQKKLRPLFEGGEGAGGAR